jgi:hypothetical protein
MGLGHACLTEDMRNVRPNVDTQYTAHFGHTVVISVISAVFVQLVLAYNDFLPIASYAALVLKPHYQALCGIIAGSRLSVQFWLGCAAYAWRVFAGVAPGSIIAQNYS